LNVCDERDDLLDTLIEVLQAREKENTTEIVNEVPLVISL
jgi:hypothetical protein